MKKQDKPIPDGFHTINAILVLRDADRALEFYQQAFGAEVNFRMDRSDGKVGHAALKIGDSTIMLGEECPPHEGHEKDCVRSPADLKGTTVNLYLYVKDVDKIFNQAIQAGGQVMMPVEDMFWGDRMGMLRDPFGHCWSLATHIEDPAPEQIKQGMEKIMSVPK